MSDTPAPKLTAPTVRGTYGVLLGVGALVLSIGLIVPFVVASKPAPITAGNDVVDGSTTGSGTTGDATGSTGVLPTATSTAGPGATGGSTGLGTTGAAGAATSGTSGTSTGTAGTGSSGAVPPVSSRKASDIGITPSAIKLGVLIPSDNSSKAGGSFGGVLGDPKLQWSAYINEVNSKGGILGRKISPVFREYDGLDLDAQRAACVYLTEQAKVFAIVNSGGFYGDPILCVTQQHKTPFIGQAGEALDFYQKSNGLYFSTTPNKDRVLRNLVAAAFKDGVFRGKKVGILSREGIDAIPVDRSLKPELKAEGISITYEARISSDDSAAQSQIPIEVQQMRSKGVDLIMMETGLIVANVFAQQADSQRYYPKYLTSDFASGGQDIYTVGMPASFAGSITYTALRTGEARAGMAETAPDAACRKTYERRSGKTLDRTTTEYSLTLTACGILTEFTQGLSLAGTNPTRSTLSGALQGIGSFNVPFSGAGSWSRNKFDAPDVVRRATWQAACKCWQPAGPFTRTKF
jgi:ABC-type branched-subunit amino acid transport system substrate-binding protein